MALEPVKCPQCGSIAITKHGKTANEKQRYLCKESDCETHTFIQDYSDKGCLPETKQKIVELAINGSGIRDTLRVFVRY